MPTPANRCSAIYIAFRCGERLGFGCAYWATLTPAAGGDDLPQFHERGFPRQGARALPRKGNAHVTMLLNFGDELRRRTAAVR